MASIPISSTDNIPKIVELAGGSLDWKNYRISAKQLSIKDVTQEALDAAWATYSSDLETYLLQPLREAVAENLGLAAHGYINNYYPSFRRELFIALSEEARNAGLTNRVAYISQLLTWIKTVVAATISAETVMEGETDPQVITDYSVDFTVFDATNPSVTIKAALAIED